MGNFGEALRDLRKRKRLSQDELGAAAGINGQTISNVETGKVEPRGDTFRAIAKGFGMTVEELEAELNTSAPPEPETIPPEVIAELFADAEQVGLSVPDYIRKARETLQRMKAEEYARRTLGGKKSNIMGTPSRGLAAKNLDKTK